MDFNFDANLHESNDSSMSSQNSQQDSNEKNLMKNFEKQQSGNQKDSDHSYSPTLERNRSTNSNSKKILTTNRISTNQNTINDDQFNISNKIQKNTIVRNSSSKRLGLSPKWKKLTNVIRTVTSLNNYKTVKLSDEHKLIDDLKLYQRKFTKTQPSNIKKCKTTSPNKFLKEKKESNNNLDNIEPFDEKEDINFEDMEKIEEKKSEFSIGDPIFSIQKMSSDDLQNTNAYLCNYINQLAYSKANVKHEILSLIINGENEERNILKIDGIFNHYKKKERYINFSDPNFIFNTSLDGKYLGKNLFYVACQEGKFKIIKCFLKHKINPLIKCKVDDDYFETPIECSVRWGYTNIVQLLLQEVKNFKKEEIELLIKKSRNKEIEKMLKGYLKSNYGDQVKCFC